MSLFFFIGFLALLLLISVLIVAAVVEVSELFKSLSCSDIRITNEGTMIERNQRQYLIHLFFSVVCIHVVCADLVFVGVIFNDPVASGGKKPYCFSNVTEYMLVDYDDSLSYFFLAAWLGRLFLFLGFYCCARALVSEDVVFFLVA